MSLVYCILAVLVYGAGIAGSGMFYGWIENNSSILSLWSLEEKEVRFLLSLFWFVTIPTYFLCCVIVYFFRYLWKFYSLFD